MKIVIFAGGAGTRLWPLSRKNTPKQFGKLLGDQSTIQQTVERLLPTFSPSDIYIATGKQYASIVSKQLPMIPKDNFIFEPAMRDVGPAIGLVSAILAKEFASEPVGILWSDHLVRNEELFRSVLLMAEKKIQQKQTEFVFIGQKPQFANQNMGWIEIAEKLEKEGGVEVLSFARLRYRPSIEEAEEFFRGDSFVWNLGYFVTTPKFLQEMFIQYAPDMQKQLSIIAQSYGTAEFTKNLETIYPTLERISFDDAILTKLTPAHILILSADLGWSDVGAWESLKEALADKEHHNVTRGNVMTEECTDNLIFSETSQLVVGIDLDGFIVVNTEDVVLICPKNSVPKIKKFVEKLSETPHKNLT